MKSKRLIIDTNLWISFLISFLISKNLTEIDELIESQEIVLIFSIELLHEFVEVAKRPKFRKIITLTDIENLLEIFDQYAELIKVTSNINICRDSKDDFLLSLAVDSKADFLVTVDNDLLVIEKINETRILTFRELIVSVIN